MKELIPKTVTVTSKCARHGDWKSDEGMVSVTFEVPADMDRKELARAVYVEKEKVDVMTLTAEFAKGRIPTDEYQQRKKAINGFYDKLLKRNQEAA